MLFKSNQEKVWWDIWNILIRIWEWCATNCYNCYSNKDNIIFYDYSKFIWLFDYIEKKCETKFDIFFYWIESIFHPDILLFLWNKSITNYRKSLHITPLYSHNNLSKILNISQGFPDVSFDTCYTIDDLKNLKSVIKFLQFVIDNNIKSTIDLFFDFDKYYKYLFDILNIISDNKYSSWRKTKNTHMWNTNCFEFIFNNWKQAILLYNAKKQTIINNEITNISNNDCIVKKSIEISKNNIYISEEIEFTYKWEITIHINAYCSKAIKIISNITKDDIDIIKDFNILNKYLSIYNTSDMWKSCYTCMNNPYSIM